MTPLPLLVALATGQELSHDRPGDAMPDRHWDVVHLELAVELVPAEGRLAGTAVHTVRPLGQRSRSLRLHQRALDIQSVKVDGEAAPKWQTGEAWIDIPMPPEGDEHTVEIAYAATPQTGLHFRDPRGSADPVVEVWSQGENSDNRHWFPSWDHPSDKFTVRTSLIVPDGLVALANGVEVGRESVREGWTKWTYELDRPIVNYLVAIAVGDYTVVREDGPVPLEYVGASVHAPSTIRRGFDRAKPQMEYLATLLDEPYPYDVYRQVMVSRFMYGGMENATLTIMADSMLQPVEGGRTLRTEEVTAHELAHQWFGDLVTCYGWRELWLNEGFATFYTGRWMEHTRGEEYYATKVLGWQRGAARLSTPMSPRGWSAVDGRENEGVYVRGATVLHMLRVYLGDDVFDAGIRLYLDRHADRLVESDDLRRALEDVSGTHLGWFFEQWVHGVGIPTVESSWSWSEGELVVTLDQTTEGRAFWAPVDVEVGGAEGVESRRVWLGEGETRLLLPLEEAPEWVAVDPKGGLLAHWTRSQEPGAWVAQATKSPSPIARIHALEQLGEAPTDEFAIATLREVLVRPEIDPAVREVAAASLGKLSTDEAVDALLSGLDQAEDSYLREAIVRALGETEGGPRVVGRLDALVKDRDPHVGGAALGALARLDDRQGLSAARQVLSRPDKSWGSQLHTAAVGVLGEHGAPSDIAVLIARSDARSERWLRQSAGWASANRFDDLDEDRLDGASKRLERPWIDALDDPDIRVRQGAIGLLGRFGGRAAEDALERFAATNEVPGMSKDALDAAASIRGRGWEEGDEGPSEEDLERLTQELEALRERLQRLEEWR